MLLGPTFCNPDHEAPSVVQNVRVDWRTGVAFNDTERASSLFGGNIFELG